MKEKNMKTKGQLERRNYKEIVKNNNNNNRVFTDNR